MFQIPHWFQCGSGSWVSNQNRSMRIRIRILVILCRHKKLGFDMKITALYEGMVMCHKNIRTYYVRKKAILKGCKSDFYFLAAGSGSAFSIRISMQESKSMRIMRIRIRNTVYNKFSPKFFPIYST